MWQIRCLVLRRQNQLIYQVLSSAQHAIDARVNVERSVGVLLHIDGDAEQLIELELGPIAQQQNVLAVFMCGVSRVGEVLNTLAHLVQGGDELLARVDEED